MEGTHLRAMSGQSQYQSVFRVGKRASSKERASRTATRNRLPVSCAHCRSRKVKCDRKAPCTPCIKQGVDDSCSFQNAPRGDGASKASAAQLRLQKLEEMVTTLLHNKKVSSDNQSSPDISLSGSSSISRDLTGSFVQNSPLPSSETSSGGRLAVNGSETNYRGVTHWETILRDIRDIQDVLDPNTTVNEEPPASDEPDSSGIKAPDLVCLTAETLTLSDVLSALPPKSQVDQLLAVYFNTRYFQFPFIHAGKFQREYESFWADASSVSFLWISILFSALHIGSQICEASGQNTVVDTAYAHLRTSFLARAAQALVTGKYHRARPYSPEAVLMYAICKYMQKEDSDADPWMIMGVSARIAMRMGYHQDPSKLSGSITPFQGEMRRRTFAVIETFELLLAFQAGLPAIIHQDDISTDPPSNLLDDDFDEDCKALPPSRPWTDPTPVLYFCHKAFLTRLFRRIVRHSASPSTSQPTIAETDHYAATLRLDDELRAIHASCPPSLQIKPHQTLASSFLEQAVTIAHRVNADCFYQKALCVLHRRYLSHDTSNAAYAYSRRTCTDAALRILSYQAELHELCQPGARLHADRWMLSSSLTLGFFLLASMIACLDLYESYKRQLRRPDVAGADMDSAAPEIQARKYDAIKRSHAIWAERSGASRDAQRASRILAFILSKVPRPDVAGNGTDTISSAAGTKTSMSDPVSGMPPSSPSTFLNGAAGIGQDVSFNASNVTNDFNSFDVSCTDPLNTILSGPDGIDWALMDQYLFNDVGDSSSDGGSGVGVGVGVGGMQIF